MLGFNIPRFSLADIRARLRGFTLPRMPRIVNDLPSLRQDFNEAVELNRVLLTNPAEAPPNIRKLDAAAGVIQNAQNQTVAVFVPGFLEIAQMHRASCEKIWAAQAQEDAWLRSHPLIAFNQPDGGDFPAILLQQPFYDDLYDHQGNKRSGSGLNAQREEFAFSLANRHLMADDQDAYLRLKREQPFYRKLYDGNRKKSDLELAWLKIDLSEADQASINRLTKKIDKEYFQRLKHRLPMPAQVDKYQIPDYTGNLASIGLHLAAVRDVKTNIGNPAPQTPAEERVVHYVLMHLATIATVASACLAAGTGLGLAGALAVSTPFINEWCGRAFGNFDTAEGILRELSWLRTKEFVFGDAISLKKLLKTTGLAIFISMAVVGAFVGGAQLAMAIPLPVANTLLSYVMGAAAAAGTGLGLVGANRFFRGVGIWDKNIPLADEHLPALTSVVVPKSSFDKTIGRIRKQLAEYRKNPDLDQTLVTRWAENSIAAVSQTPALMQFQQEAQQRGMQEGIQASQAASQQEARQPRRRRAAGGQN